MSSLEGELICRFMEKSDDLGGLLECLLSPINKPYRPHMTTNQFARLCIEKGDIYDEAGDWSLKPCIFLDNGICRIYEVRPFSCRALVSLSDCQNEGAACMPPVLVTLNTIVHQIIEHLSLGGWWGNMLDVLPHVLMLRGVVDRRDLSREFVLRDAEPLPGFLVQEKERPVVQKYLDEIGQVLQKFEVGEIRGEVKTIQQYLANCHV